MPVKLRRVGAALEKLSLDERNSVVAKFGIYRRSNGVEWTNSEKASMLGVSQEHFRLRVRRAERKLMRLGVV